MGTTAKFAFLMLAVLVVAGSGARADWVANGVSISSATYEQRYPVGIADGAGGMIVVWNDSRSTAPGSGPYAQRVDGWGNPLWTADGVQLYDVWPSTGPKAASDGAGGAIVIWADRRNGSSYARDLFAQRVDPSGALLWGPAGVTISTAATQQRDYQIVADGAGGAIVAWQDSSAGNADIYAQRLDESGAALWTAGGVAVCTNAFEQHKPCLVSDELGGAIVAWDDHRGGPSDIYAQRIDASGAATWTANGRVVCNAANAQQEQVIVSDDAGGAIVAWRDYRNSADWLVYSQRIDGDGSPKWTANGVAASTTVTDMYGVTIASDGWNGAIVVWAQTNIGNENIYAQRLSYLGFREWTAGGTVVCGYPNVQNNPAVVPDGDRGAIVAWLDYRNESPLKDVYAQRISSTGGVMWNVNGNAICAAAGDQSEACIVPDGGGGGIFAWSDYRGANEDLYAQRMDGYGNWGYPCATITSVQDVSPDQGGHVTVTWTKSRLENPMAAAIDRYSVWRMLPAAQTAAFVAAGEKGIEPARLAEASPGTIYISRAAGAASGWELLVYVDATVSETYSATVETLFDSTAADPGIHQFMVMAHGSDRFMFWESQPASGWSVDNVAPAQPVSFTAVQSFDPEGLTLSWSGGVIGALAEGDFSHYELYRGISLRFVPGPENRIYSGPDTTYFDGEWRWSSGFFYRLAAFDVHGNASLYALVAPDDVTGTETPAVPAAAYLEQNAPNPFNPSTTIRFGLVTAGRATLGIYDVSGRLVRTLFDGPRSAGVYREVWDGSNDAGRAVSSGVYFYRLRAGTFSATKKMVLAR